MTDIRDFSVLAPVPLGQLQSGAEISRDASFGSFGSRKWELFRKIDEARGGARVPVLIYPSYESWLGWYVGCEESGNGKHSKGMMHRPATTGSDNQGLWALWRICDLRELAVAQRLPIAAIQTANGGRRKGAPPRGPELVATPSTLELSL